MIRVAGCFAGAHGLAATCHVWDQWEDRFLATLAPQMFLLSRFWIDTILYVKTKLYIM